MTRDDKRKASEMTQPNATVELTPAQESAVVALCAGATVADVLAETGVNRTTLWRWRSTPAWRAREAQLRIEVSVSVLARVHAMVETAAATVDREAATNAELAFKVLDRFGPIVWASPTGPIDPAEIAEADADRAANLRHQREERAHTRAVTATWRDVDATGWPRNSDLADRQR